MLIQPGFNSSSVLDAPELLLVDSKRWIDVLFKDESGNNIDLVEEMTSSGEAKGELDLQVTNLSGTVLYSEQYWPPPIPDTRRIQHPSTGKYYIKWGVNSGETDSAGPLLFAWHIRKDIDTEDIYRVQLAEVASARVLSLLPRMRLLLDKSLKIVVPEEYCNLGYSDAQLLTYLNMGLSRINATQPFPSWSSIDVFPLEGYFEILIRSALLSALTSQALFSVDTDIASFSDQGHAFILQHFPSLKAMLDSLSAELEKDIREFKLHFVGSGSIGAEFRLGWSFYQTLTSAPPGSLFRNTIAYMP